MSAFDQFAESDATLFALLGYAGTGKTFIMSYFLKNAILDPIYEIGERIFATPTHKATWVARRFLSEQGVKFEVGFDKFDHTFGRLITGTTSSLLGMRPVIADDQKADEIVFDRVGDGVLRKVSDPLDWIIIDEVSMLSQADLDEIVARANVRGSKVLIIGDPGQLPPVKAQGIAWDRIDHGAILKQVMRTPNGSAIPRLGEAVRQGHDWTRVDGPGVSFFNNPAGAFIDELNGPPALDERDRMTFIAYTNARVNAVQDAACQKIYGHSRHEFGANEVVVASRPLYRGRDPLCQNGDVLEILEVSTPDDDMFMQATFMNMRGRKFEALFLPEREAFNQKHPFNVRERELRKRATALQAEYNSTRDKFVDVQRRAAWADYFEHRDGTMISASHGFAITSHKSQGSTYRQAFVDADDISEFSVNGLYVAATRPSEELIIG